MDNPIRNVIDLLEDTIRDPFFPQHAAAYQLSALWTRMVQPYVVLPRERWIELFKAVGYFDQSPGGTDLPEFIRLYRGSPADASRRMSWTDDFMFAHEFTEWDSSPVWTALVPREAVLAIIDLKGRLEFVVDLPDEVEVRELDYRDGADYFGWVFDFGTATPAELESAVTSFLARHRLHDLRPSALGWVPVSESAAKFSAHPDVLFATRSAYNTSVFRGEVTPRSSE